MKRCAVVIPALNPEESLTDYTKQLIQLGFDRIIVVNDGSGPAAQPVFDALRQTEKCTVLEHRVNRGKGRALRTALGYFLSRPELEEYEGVVTADADGQHLARDVKRVAEALEDNPHSLVLGCRDFDSENVPFKSRKGNKITSAVMRVLFSQYISDTQTGLRGISREYCRRCMRIRGDRFEYEINMLIDAMINYSVVQIPIRTVYFHQNRATSFKAVKDSVKIYRAIFRQFFRFCFAALSSAAIDLGLFSLLVNHIFMFLPAENGIFVSSVCARLVSASYNYMVNRLIVFKSGRKAVYSIIRYITLAARIMLMSACGVRFLYTIIPINKTFIKIVVDLALFIASYKVQQAWVFKNK